MISCGSVYGMVFRCEPRCIGDADRLFHAPTGYENLMSRRIWGPTVGTEGSTSNPFSQALAVFDQFVLRHGSMAPRIAQRDLACRKALTLAPWSRPQHLDALQPTEVTADCSLRYPSC